MLAAGASRALGAADLRAIDEGIMAKTLDQIFGDETPEDDANRDEQGRFAAAPEPEAQAPEQGVEQEPEQPEPDSGPPPQEVAEAEPDRVPVAALKDERAKRQKLEDELAQMRQQLNQMQYQPPQPQVPQAPQAAPDMFEDPEGYTAYIQERAAEAAFNRAMEAQRIERVKITAMAARQKYQDFDTVVGTFQQLASANPVLEQQMLQQPDPAEWAYKTAKTHLEVSQYGSLEAAIEARVQAELANRAAAAPQVPQAPKATLADAQSARSSQVPVYRPKTLAEILA